MKVQFKNFIFKIFMDYKVTFLQNVTFFAKENFSI